MSIALSVSEKYRSFLRLHRYDEREAPASMVEQDAKEVESTKPASEHSRRTAMKANGQLSTIIFVVGRFIVGGMYLMAGLENLVQLDAKAGYTASKGVSNPTFWVTVAGLLL